MHPRFFVAYERAWAWQRQLVEQRIAGAVPDLLLLVEHEPVITAGSGSKAEHLLLSPEEYRRRGIACVRTDRGGDVTYHGPGQLVLYPILQLRPEERDAHRYLRRLEEAGIESLAHFGVPARRRAAGTGLWTGRGKIAALGVRLRRWVTYHGMALNVTTDLAPFETIVPCGLDDRRVTSMAAELAPAPAPDLAEVAAALADAMARVFDRPFQTLAGDACPAPAARERPPWLRVAVRPTAAVAGVDRILRRHGLHTVCEEAACPNLHECYGAGTATFLIMGDICTRRCGFCAVATGRPTPLDPEEPDRVAAAVAELGLRFAVITSVDRDDLPDGGAEHVARTVEAIRAQAPRCAVEVLAPDFKGVPEHLEVLFRSRPDIVGFNIETVERLHRRARPQTSYATSLAVLGAAARARGRYGFRVKSGFMLGLGESPEDIRATLADLAAVPCDLVTIGQYLAPTPRHLPVERYATPEEFAAWAQEGERLGIGRVYAGPLVRSSYHAEAQAR